MKIIINHSSMQPIYEQITDQIKAMIIDGTFKGRGNASLCENFGEGAED